MFLMPETFPSVCNLNTDSDFTSEGKIYGIHFHTFFCFSGDFVL